MNLLAEYEAQDQWRDWDAMLKRLPIVRGQTVLDLGCGPGSVSARLAARATNVIGVDHNAEFISAAQQRCPAIGPANTQEMISPSVATAMPVSIAAGKSCSVAMRGAQAMVVPCPPDKAREPMTTPA